MTRWVCTRCTKLFQDTAIDRGPPSECEHCQNTEFERIGEPRRSLPERILSITGFVRVCQAVIGLAILIAVINGFQRNFNAAAWGGVTALAAAFAAFLVGRRTMGVWVANAVIFVLGLVSSIGVLGLIDWYVLPSVTIMIGINIALFVAGLAILVKIRSNFG